MATVIYGGAFDPLHLGHEFIIDYVVNRDEVDRLILIPTGIPAHKDKSFFSASFRMQMVKAISETNDKILTLDYEMNKKGPSYTVDTLSYIRTEYPDDAYFLVVGFDQLYQFHRWRQYHEILKYVTLWVMPRDGIQQDRLMEQFPKELEPYQDKFIFHDAVPPKVSSTQIRIFLEQNREVNSFVSSTVLSYIQLYMSGKDL